MEELWKHHGAAHPHQVSTNANAITGQHPFVAQEVCVTIRQETLGTAANHLINFGGLDAGGGGGGVVAKHHQHHHHSTANNQLLALVQQQQQQQHHSLHHAFNSYTHHPHPPSSSSSLTTTNAIVQWPAVQELHPHPTGTRPLVTDVPSTSPSLDRDLLKNRSRTFPEKRSNVDFFKDSSFSRSIYDTSQCFSTDSRSHHQQQLQGTPPQRRATTSTHSFPAGLRVYTPGAQGFVANGELLFTDKRRLEVMCLCHGYTSTVAKFVQQHAGTQSVNPGNAVYMETGETLVQWRRNVFTRVGVPVPDDEADWDWCDGSEASRNVHTSKVPDTLASCQGVNQVTSLPASVSYGNYQDSVFQSFNRSFKGAELLSSQLLPSQLQRIAGSVKPMHFDFINGSRAYSSAEQHHGSREKMISSDHARKPWDENGRQDKDNFASNFELRLGQPSQQAHKAGTALGAVFRSQYQPGELDQPSSLVYERAYHKIDASLHQGSVNSYGFQAQQEFTQQQRLEKINVLNIAQFGPTSLERTVIGEKTRYWTEASNSSQNGSRAPAEHADTFCQLKPQLPESSVEMLSQTQVKQRLVSHRLVNDVVGLPPIEGQQQFVPHEYTPAGWTNCTSIEARYLPSKEKEVVHCFGNDGTRGAPQDILACRMSSSSFVQQQGVDNKGTGSASVLAGQEPLELREQHTTKACLSQQLDAAAEARVANPPRSASPGNAVSLRKPAIEDSYVVAQGSRDSPALLTSREKRDDAKSLTELDDRQDPHHQVTPSIIPAAPGLLVPVDEDDAEKSMPLQNASFGWNSHVKNCNDLDLSGDGEGQGIVTGKSISSDEEGESSEVSTKSSENVGREDMDEETSTLESESQEPDLVDEGSGIRKHRVEELASPSDRSCSEANESVMVEGLHGLTDEEQKDEVKVEKRGRKKVMSLNNAIMVRNIEAFKTGSGVSETKDNHHERHDEQQKSFRKCTRTQKRSRTPVRKTRSATVRNKNDNVKGVEKSTLCDITVRSRRVPADQRNDNAIRTKHSGAENGGNGKMLSLKSIMKHSIERRTGFEAGSRVKDAEEQGCMEDGSAPRKEIRKRKLSELNSSIPATVTCRPFRVGQSAIPRGERSPRKSKFVATRRDSPRHIPPSTPKKKLDTGQISKSSIAETTTAKRRRSTSHQQSASTASGADEPQMVNLLEEEKKQSKKAQTCKQNVCSVCGSSKSESHNQLICCSSCPVTVHQACYGVPKAPNSSWSCRACKSEVENIVCVLCGYSGGAMTRAQNAQAVVKGLLKAWKPASIERPKLGLKQVRRSVRNSLREVEEISNTITASVSDPSVTQWVHMVCALWMPGTRCLNLGTMGMFDVSGVSVSRRRLTCSICKREGGSCIQCHEAKCAVPFHAWCAHSKGLLQIETVNDADGHVRFHGKCVDHLNAVCAESRHSSKCARTAK